MSLALRALIRDRLVDDGTMQGLLGVSTTGSAPVSLAFMEASGVYPQIVYSLTDEFTDPGMDVQNGSVSFSIGVQSTGSVNPVVTIGNILDRISGLFDDQSVSGVGLSGTGVNSLLFLRIGGPAYSYNDQRKVYRKIMSYSYKVVE